MGYTLLFRPQPSGPVSETALAAFAFEGTKAEPFRQGGALRGVDLDVPYELDEVRGEAAITGALAAARALALTAYDPQTSAPLMGSGPAVEAWRKGRAMFAGLPEKPKAGPDKAVARLRLAFFAVSLLVAVLAAWFVLRPIVLSISGALSGE